MKTISPLNFLAIRSIQFLVVAIRGNRWTIVTDTDMGYRLRELASFSQSLAIGQQHLSKSETRLVKRS
jgi:hypothetical protein